jgi:uncharacterized membrane protein
MNLAQLHLWLNHLPILGTLITLGLFIVALVGKRDDLKQVSLALFSLIALFAIPAYMSGTGAQQAIQETPDISMALIERHQGAALLAFIFMEITGVVALMGLWRYSRTDKNPWMSRPARLNLSAVLLLAIATSGLMAVTGNTGGDIRHPEILAAEEAPPSIIGDAGGQLHFFGLILLLGTVGVLNLRILGFLKRLPVAPLHRFIPWGMAGFALNVITGFFFYIGMPGFYNPNFVFQLKIFAIMLGGIQLLLFYSSSAFRTLEHVGPGEDAPALAKVMAATAIVLWIAVIILGRYIPFGEVT